MSKIHLGKEITVINTADTGNAFDSLQAFADDLKQSFGGLKSVADEATQTVNAFNETLCEVDGVLRAQFMNDILLAGQDALILDNTLQEVNTQFQAFLQTYIQSDFFKQVAQMLTTTATEIEQLNLAIDGKLVPAIMLLASDLDAFIKSSRGGDDSGLDKIDKWLDIIEHGVNIFKGGRDIYRSFKGTGEVGEEPLLKYGEYPEGGGGDMAAQTGELGIEGEEVGAGIVEGLEELSLAIGPEGWIVAGLIGLGTVIYHAVKSNAEEDQQNNSVEYGGGDFGGAGAGGWWDGFTDANSSRGDKYPLMHLAPVGKGNEKITNYVAAPGTSGYKWDMDAAGGQSPQIAPLTTGSGGLSYPESLDASGKKDNSAFSIEDMPRPRRLPSAFELGQKQKCTSIVFNINTMAQFNDTYTGAHESLNDIHDKVVQILTNAISDAKVNAETH